MTVTQDQFTRAMLDPGAAIPAGLANPDGRPATRRFDVYRNNVAVSLTEALEQAFPVIRKLVGETNFRVLAGVYLRQHPPASPLMMHYGQEMPGFLARFEPVQSLGYLPDVARLELALRASYHATDSRGVDPARLQSLPPDALMASVLHLAPSLRLVRSDWPIHGIWRFNMDPGAPRPEPRAEDVLILRPEFDPTPSLLSPGGGVFVARLQAGDTLSGAHDAALDAAPGFDLAPLLGHLIAAGAITGLTEGDLP